MTAIVGLVLYGSRARGDHDERSDVDLLAIAAGGPPAVVTRDGLTVSRYAVDHLLRRARSGDLFALHLVSEGTVIYERAPVFAQMKRAFRYRSEYWPEIAMASDVGWFLVHHHERAADGRRLNGRMAWCTHTMIAARAAMARQPVFSAAGLAAYSGSGAVASVIGSRRSATVDPAVVDQFRHVLVRFGGPEPEPLETLAAEERRFHLGRNPAGAVAIRAMLHPDGIMRGKASR